MASARALTAAGGSGNAISEKKRTRTENEEHKRVFDLFSHAARLASKLSTGARFADDDGSVTRGSADSGTVDDVVRAAVPAGKFSMGHDSSCLLTFGGDLESAASSEVSFAKKTDAPFSNHVTLKTVRAAVVDITVTDFSLQLPLAPGPLFAVRKAQITGPMALARQVPELGGSVVQARQVPPKHGSALVSEKDDATTPTLPSLPIGRRRFVAAKSPTALKKPPVKLYTDLEVSLVRPTGCFAVSAEPALVGLLRELTRLTPPPGLRHKNAPGGGGGRDAHALATAELFRFAVLEKWKNGVSSPPPALPIWDVLRVTWRGKARVLLTDFAYVLDPRCGVSNSLLKRSRGPVGFEVGAKKTEIEITAGSVAVKVARLAFARRIDIERSEAVNSTKSSERLHEHVTREVSKGFRADAGGAASSAAALGLTDAVLAVVKGEVLSKVRAGRRRRNLPDRGRRLLARLLPRVRSHGRFRKKRHRLSQ